MFPLPFEIPPRSADAHVEDGQRLMLGSMPVDAIHTPGHAPGHVMYHFPEQRILVGGDLIIGGSVGRTDLPDSDHRDARRIDSEGDEASPGDAAACPDTAIPAPLAHERDNNPFVRQALAL
jgi:glyoxylase-like metal-dependent hydrolase (beta-lactamase superfamily II)